MLTLTDHQRDMLLRSNYSLFTPSHLPLIATFMMTLLFYDLITLIYGILIVTLDMV